MAAHPQEYRGGPATNGPRRLWHILLLGAPELTRPARPVESLAEIPSTLITGLTQLLNAHQEGVGIAATQVGADVRVAVVVLGRRDRRVMINPEIVERSLESELGLEGCLSIPEFQASIRRHKSIRVHFRDEKFATQDLSGLDARIVQHEVDHLDGKMITDNLSSMQRRAAQKCVDKARRAS